MKKNKDLTSLKEQLDKLNWPAIYPFKFIVPIEKLEEVWALFKKEDSKTKVSRNGNYVSVTVTPFMYTSDKVIEVYNRALEIDGLMAL